MFRMPKEITTEYETAVDAFRKDNLMEAKFTKVEEPIEEIK